MLADTLTIVIPLTVFAYGVWLAVRMVRNRKKRKGCGGCSGCSGCPYAGSCASAEDCKLDRGEPPRE